VEHAPFVIVQATTAEVPAGTPLTFVVNEVGDTIVAVPLTTLHEPMPVKATFPVAVKSPLLHWLVVAPAMAVVPGELFERVIVLVEEGQVPLEIVQRITALFPADTVTIELGDAAFAMEAIPLTTLHAPVPTVGVFAAIVNDELLH